jgi:hypothetical protein
VDDEVPQWSDLDQELADEIARWLMPADAARENRKTVELIRGCRDPKLSSGYWTGPCRCGDRSSTDIPGSRTPLASGPERRPF